MIILVTSLGWINVLLIVMMGSTFPIKKLYLKKYKEKGKEGSLVYGKIFKISKIVHPITGVLILMIGIYHGLNAYSLFVFHTGTILLYTLFLTAIIAFVGKKTKWQWRLIHKTLGFIIFILMIVHVFWRNLI